MIPVATASLHCGCDGARSREFAYEGDLFLALGRRVQLAAVYQSLDGVVAIRRGNVARHRGAMRGSWFGLIGAFIGAVAVPKRRIPTFAVSDPVGAVATAAAIVALTLGLILLAHRIERWAPWPHSTTRRPLAATASTGLPAAAPDGMTRPRV